MAGVSDVKVNMERLRAGVVHGTGLCWNSTWFSRAPFPTRYFNNPVWIKEVTVKGAMT